MKKALAHGVALAAGWLAAGCFYTDEPAAQPPMVPASGGVIDTYYAATVISEARCNHEAKCNGIGPTARYTSFDHCMSVLHADALGKFQGCRYGVKDPALRQCVQEIRTQVCGGLVAPIDWFERSVVCRVSQLCLN